MKSFYKLSVTLFSLLIIACSSLFPQASSEVQEDLGKRSTLSGDWGGLRSNLAKRGFYIEGNYVGDVLTNQGGGINEDTEYLDNIELKLPT